MRRSYRIWFLTALFTVHALASATAADPPVQSLGRVFENLKAGKETTIGYFLVGGCQ